MLNLAISTLLLTLMVLGAQAQLQTLTLFSEKGCRGFYLKIAPTNSIINLEASGFNNTAQSVRGGESWIFYNDTDLRSGGDVEFINFRNHGIGCYSFRHLSKKISSLRLASQLDQAKRLVPGIYLFPKPNFYGPPQFYQTGGVSAVSYQVASIVFTGKSPWTIYGQTGYTGPAFCLRPEDSTGTRPTFIPDTMQMETPINYNFIKSFMQGCRV